MPAAQWGLRVLAPKCGACPMLGCRGPQFVLGAVVTQSTRRSLPLAHLLSFGTGVTFEAGETRGTLQSYTGRHVRCGEHKAGDPPVSGSCGEGEGVGGTLTTGPGGPAWPVVPGLPCSPCTGERTR